MSTPLVVNEGGREGGRQVAWPRGPAMGWDRGGRLALSRLVRLALRRDDDESYEMQANFFHAALLWFIASITSLPCGGEGRRGSPPDRSAAARNSGRNSMVQDLVSGMQSKMTLLSTEWDCEAEKYCFRRLPQTSLLGAFLTSPSRLSIKVKPSVAFCLSDAARAASFH